MPPLSDSQLKDFLTGQAHIMKLATLTSEGWPSVNPVWYEYDGETFLVAGRKKAAWVANIKNDSRVSLCIDTSEGPYTRVLMEATAEVIDDSWLPQSSARAIRYLGEEAGLAYYSDTHQIPRSLIKITPRKTTTWTGGGWHPKYRP